MNEKEIVEIIKSKLIYARKRKNGNKYTMNDNLTKHGGWTIGYFSGMTTALEGLLDDINENWEDDFKKQNYNKKEDNEN